MIRRWFCLVAVWVAPLWFEPELQAAESASPVAAIAGQWTYRSFHNNPSPVGGDAQKALALIFAEAVFTFKPIGAEAFSGTIDWGSGGLNLKGVLLSSAKDIEPAFEIIGTGRPGTQTEGWRYDYHGRLAHHWPNGVNQIPALVGSVIRGNPHNGAPAGYVASFIAVKQGP